MSDEAYWKERLPGSQPPPAEAAIAADIRRRLATATDAELLAIAYSVAWADGDGQDYQLATEPALRGLADYGAWLRQPYRKATEMPDPWHTRAP